MGTSSSPPPVQSMSPRQRGMPSGIMMISQALWKKVITKLGIIEAKVRHIKEGVST